MPVAIGDYAATLANRITTSAIDFPDTTVEHARWGVQAQPLFSTGYARHYLSLTITNAPWATASEARECISVLVYKSDFVQGGIVNGKLQGTTRTARDVGKRNRTSYS